MGVAVGTVRVYVLARLLVREVRVVRPFAARVVQTSMVRMEAVRCIVGDVVGAGEINSGRIWMMNDVVWIDERGMRREEVLEVATRGHAVWESVKVVVVCARKQAPSHGLRSEASTLGTPAGNPYHYIGRQQGPGALRKYSVHRLRSIPGVFVGILQDVSKFQDNTW
jgi:hypothetical protein